MKSNHTPSGIDRRMVVSTLALLPALSATLLPASAQAAQALVAQHIASFQQFPPRQKPGSFSVEQAMEKLRNPPSTN